MRRILIGVAIACVIVAGALAWHAATTSDDARSVRGEATRIEHDTKLITAKAIAERRQSGASPSGHGRAPDAARPSKVAAEEARSERGAVAGGHTVTFDAPRDVLASTPETPKTSRVGLLIAIIAAVVGALLLAGALVANSRAGDDLARARARRNAARDAHADADRFNSMNAAVNNAITALENAEAAYSQASNGEPV
jgi:hypothetical protein